MKSVYLCSTAVIKNAGCVRVYANWIPYFTCSDTKSFLAIISHGRFISTGTVGMKFLFCSETTWSTVAYVICFPM